MEAAYFGLQVENLYLIFLKSRGFKDFKYDMVVMDMDMVDRNTKTKTKTKTQTKFVRDISTFRNLFAASNGVKSTGYIRVHKEVVSNTSFSDIDFTSIIEIHPRLNLAFALVYLRDIKVSSKTQVIELLNRFLFPLHAKKPLTYSSGRVSMESKLPIFLSENILKLLGFYKGNVAKKTLSLKLPLKNEFKGRVSQIFFILS